MTPQTAGLVIPQAFLAVDAILNIYLNITDSLVVYDNMIAKHIGEELPFMATENILMLAVKNGGDRQELHEKIREYSMIAAKRVKEEGKDNNLLELIAADPAFKINQKELDDMMSPANFIGRAGEQVTDFIKNEIDPILKDNQQLLGLKANVSV